MKLPIVSKSSDILYFKFFSSLFQAKSSLHFKSKNDNVSSQRITVEWPVKKSKIALPKVMSMPMLSDCYHWKLIGWGTPLEKEFDEPPHSFSYSNTPILLQESDQLRLQQPAWPQLSTSPQQEIVLHLGSSTGRGQLTELWSMTWGWTPPLLYYKSWRPISSTDWAHYERDSAWTSTFRFDPWHKLAIKQQFS